jgi:membrane fusion protein (multidrug efflux system)
VLVGLDSRAERLALQERQARRAALQARRHALGREIQTEEEAVRAQRHARVSALAEARAQVAQAEARAKFAERQAETSAQLRLRQAISEEEFQRSKAEVVACRAAVQASTFAVDRLEQDRVVQESERKARLAKLEREAVEITGEVTTEEAAIRRLEHDLELRLIRTPLAGRVGEAVELRVGAVVRAAEQLGSIVPPGEPRAVALFPASAVGRIHPGQPARLRLDGFPWTQYGSLAAATKPAMGASGSS